MPFGISRELVSGNTQQAAEKIAEVAVITRPIREMRKQADPGFMKNLKDFARKIWANDAARRSLVGAGIGAGVGGFSHLLAPKRRRKNLLGSMFTGGLAGGGIGLGYHALRSIAEGKPVFPGLGDPGVAYTGKTPEEHEANLGAAIETATTQQQTADVVGDVFGPGAGETVENWFAPGIGGAPGPLGMEVPLPGHLLAAGAAPFITGGTDLAVGGTSLLKRFIGSKYPGGIVPVNPDTFIKDMKAWLATPNNPYSKQADQIIKALNRQVSTPAGHANMKKILRSVVGGRRYGWGPFKDWFNPTRRWPFSGQAAASRSPSPHHITPKGRVHTGPGGAVPVPGARVPAGGATGDILLDKKLMSLIRKQRALTRGPFWPGRGKLVGLTHMIAPLALMTLSNLYGTSPEEAVAMHIERNPWMQRAIDKGVTITSEHLRTMADPELRPDVYQEENFRGMNRNLK